MMAKLIIVMKSQASRESGAESGGSLPYKHNIKMAELPKDINPTDQFGYFFVKD